MEKILRDINLAKLFVSRGLFSFLFYHFQSLCNSWTSSSWSSSRRTVKSPDYKVRLSREEVVMVMERLGLMSGAESEGDEGIEEAIGEEEVEALFEKEPSLEELKDVFEVFDENGDSFMEARELQRVLKCLGLEREIEECSRMISVFDLNGDGLIDRSEFVKFMEQIFVT
ncbi:probable calcium-binding protein CML46 [Prosopis cineraria]|uniref:probable calcium-binding protein CML46 n=1 Tax=Prosopis cineraria TaxID=364024 RepID=UPI00240FDEE4|nr:probable calcium-binding protein CML46 [Prosopis cineraria]